MGKSIKGKGKGMDVQKQEKYLFPSHYGSHASMVDQAETSRLDSEWCVCKDEYGMYVTLRRNVDTGLADPYRAGSLEWRTQKLQEVTGQVIDIIIRPEVVQ